MTATALKVEPVDFNAEIVLIKTCFFSHIKLGALIKKVAACFTAHTHRQHHSYIILLVSWTHDFLQLSVVEVGRIVLVQNFTLRHSPSFSLLFIKFY